LALPSIHYLRQPLWPHSPTILRDGVRFIISASQLEGCLLVEILDGFDQAKAPAFVLQQMTTPARLPSIVGAKDHLAFASKDSIAPTFPAIHPEPEQWMFMLR
jgi:hypothetical protein